MKGKQKFFKCSCCGNLISFIIDKGVPLVCCDEDMVELFPNANAIDESNQKHVSGIATANDTSAQNSDIPHPMENDHYIEFIYVETENGCQRKFLKPGDSPNARFSFVNDRPIAIYAYCFQHGLWKKKLNLIDKHS